MKIGTVVTLARGLDEAPPGAHYPQLRVEALAEEVAWAREFGFGGLQIGWRGAPPAEPEEIAAAFGAEGVEVIALSAYTDLLGAEHNWPCKDLAAVKDMIALARPLGTDLIVTWGGFGDPSDPEDVRVVHSALAEEAACAGEHDVRIAIELYDRCVVGTVEQVNAAREALDTDALGVMMDPPNTMQEADLADLPGYYHRLMDAAGPWLFGAHAKDVLFEAGERKLPGPGEGAQDYVAYIRALAEAGYDGYLAIEHVNRDTVGPARDYVAAKLAEALPR